MLNFLVNSLTLASGALLGNQATLRIACYKQPRPMPHQLAWTLDHPWRLKYRNPSEDVGLYGCGAGIAVLDIGCGVGLYTVALAERVGDTGRVHAVDLQAPMIERARQRVVAAGFDRRVQFHHAGAYQLPLPDASIDLAVMVATLPQIPNRLLALAELSRVLKPEGRLAISEELPDPAYVPPPTTRRWVEEAGFTYGGQSGNWFCYHLVCFNSGTP